jgi:hypothetical protein
MEVLMIKSMLLGLVAGLRPILIPVLLAILANRVHARRRGLDRLSQWAVVHGVQVFAVMALLIGGGLFLNGMSALQ